MPSKHPSVISFSRFVFAALSLGWCVQIENDGVPSPVKAFAIKRLLENQNVDGSNFAISARLYPSGELVFQVLERENVSLDTGETVATFLDVPRDDDWTLSAVLDFMKSCEPKS